MVFSDCWKCSGEEEGKNFQNRKQRGRGIFRVFLFHNNDLQFFLPSNPVSNLNLLLGFFIFLRKILFWQNIEYMKQCFSSFSQNKQAFKWKITLFHRLVFLWLHLFFYRRIRGRKRQNFSAEKKMERLCRIQKNTGGLWCSLSFPFSTQYFASNPTEWVSEPTSFRARIWQKFWIFPLQSCSLAFL